MDGGGRHRRGAPGGCRTYLFRLPLRCSSRTCSRGGFMRPRSFARWLSSLVATAVLYAAPACAADVQVMISAGFYGAYSELVPAFARATGHHLLTTRGPSIGDSPETIPARLGRGESADVVILDAS